MHRLDLLNRRCAAPHRAANGGLVSKYRRLDQAASCVEPEIVSRKQDLWTYAVFAAALLRDIGKVVVDQRVTIVDKRGRSTGDWDVWQGPMNKGMWYPYLRGF